jgi:hypothetical protein
MIFIIEEFIQNGIILNEKIFRSDYGNFWMIDDVINSINNIYLSYYIQEIEKLILGNRKKELHLWTTDDVESDDYTLGQYVIVNKDFCICPEEFVEENWPNPKMETQQLLEYLKFIRTELGISDVIKNDNRCNVK